MTDKGKCPACYRVYPHSRGICEVCFLWGEKRVSLNKIETEKEIMTWFVEYRENVPTFPNLEIQYRHGGHWGDGAVVNPHVVLVTKQDDKTPGNFPTISTLWQTCHVKFHGKSVDPNSDARKFIDEYLANFSFREELLIEDILMGRIRQLYQKLSSMLGQKSA